MINKVCSIKFRSKYSSNTVVFTTKFNGTDVMKGCFPHPIVCHSFEGIWVFGFPQIPITPQREHPPVLAVEF